MENSIAILFLIIGLFLGSLITYLGIKDKLVEALKYSGKESLQYILVQIQFYKRHYELNRKEVIPNDRNHL